MIRRLVLVFAVLLPCICQAQDTEVLAKITDEAIQQRIAEHRMGDLVIHAPAGSKVHIQQTRHEFKFGTAIPNSLAEMSENPMSPKQRQNYLQLLADNFNYAVHENALKWYDTEKQMGQVNYEVADRIWELADSLNIPMRGHTIYWAKDEFLMDWLKALDNDSLRLAVRQRAESLVTHYQGKISEFDLNNEMIHGDFFRRRLGYGIVNEMAWMVKALNPDAKLYMNDYGILDVGLNAGAYASQIEKLLANGVPLDGIGMQAHRAVNGDYTNTRYMVQRNLDRFNRFGLPIKITEALFVYDTDEKRAEELNRLFPIYFAHPNVEAILIWGVWAGDHWIPSSAMWDEHFKPSLQAKAYQKWVFDRWWTDETLTVGTSGKVSLRAFYGEYDISVDGVTQNVSLQKQTGQLSVTFR